MSDERRMVYAGIRSPEESIRTLVRNLSGYDVPLLGVSGMGLKGGLMGKVGAGASAYGNANALGSSFQGGFIQKVKTPEEQAREAAARKADWDRQVMEQQKRSDSIKQDLQRRGLVR
jgi:hypothetical protein